MLSSAPLTVTQLNKYVKFLLEESEPLRGLLVAGEVSNFKNHYSGHWYFTLKDAGAAVPAVMFRESNRRLGFVPQDGMSVVIRGRASLYERDGKFQLYADDMQPDGLGALYLAYEQLKERLAAEGLFDPGRKRELPFFPARVGVVTSGTGAAVRDILQILARRCPASEAVLCPVQVQGAGAAAQIAAAVRLFNDRQAADVLIVGRGGGSLEDLWAFNEEPVARAVAASAIPVISAVGHETDVTICDFAADLRAPTPSAAAELAVPDLADLLAGLGSLRARMGQTLLRDLRARRASLETLLSRRVLRRPEELAWASSLRLDYAAQRLRDAIKARLYAESARLARASARLEAMSPLAVLARGYAIAMKGGAPVKSVSELDPGDKLRLALGDGACSVIVWEA
ncbi:MAG: exodeoxyribonuclease VII large subunit [Oscillospiraceae bacterium]|jgi:exodeoxyribonuclease VII large subunit|nr:exodeoxyribonuclease VII large subunit [Oscillospiraceae bacterium]